MDCKKAKMLIPLAADGILDDDAVALLNDHTASCKDCARLLNEHNELISEISAALISSAEPVCLSSDFASNLAMLASADTLKPYYRLSALRARLAQSFNAFGTNRKAVTTAACTALLIASLAVGIISGRMLDSSPVASARISSGRMVAFTVRPQPNGQVAADVNVRRYCKVAHGAEELFR